MNAHTPLDDALPELSDQRIDELEDALFAGIAHDRDTALAQQQDSVRRRTRRHRAIWWTTAAAATVVVAAVAVGPLLGTLGLTGSGTNSGAPALPLAPDKGEDSAGGGQSIPEAGKPGTDTGGRDVIAGDRDIIASAQATVRVDDVPAAAQRIGDAATRRGGYVESMSVGDDGVAASGAEGGIVDDTLPYPRASGAWITIRVPADQLTDAIAELSAIGTVESSSINRQDVTSQAVDLRARVDALEASVTRLTELMAKTGSVADLIAAESALAQRQGELESYQQQLKALEDQVALSSLTVSLVAHTEPVAARPAGFADGLLAGWNGLVATANGLVIAIGFLLPWLVVAAVVAVVVWLIVRGRRRHRRTPEPPSATAA